MPVSGLPELWLIRHGETEWSRSGQHTSRTDLPLTEQGEQRARQLGKYLNAKPFALVLTSPMQRARSTCRLAGFGEQSEIDADLLEWDYGDYEGLTTAEIRKTAPNWTVWTAPCPNGESAAQVGARADAVIGRATRSNGPTALFGHGHMLRVLAARWLGLDANAGRLFALSTGTISVLGHERDSPVIQQWNLAP